MELSTLSDLDTSISSPPFSTLSTKATLEGLSFLFRLEPSSRLLERALARSSEPLKFKQAWHLQLVPQKAAPVKHSQYFFKHADFLQWHPVIWPTTPTPLETSAATLGLKASGFLSTMLFMAWSRSARLDSILEQSLQLQLSLQNSVRRKQSQYIFRHRLFLQLQVVKGAFSAPEPGVTPMPVAALLGVAPGPLLGGGDSLGPAEAEAEGGTFLRWLSAPTVAGMLNDCIAALWIAVRPVQTETWD
mmetsp:Transcript_3504/g.7701  ORF Transcript_3504/g.7701 Transcript_3504/m.7701 type:complete len:246 (-) Transcript_3504:81-818(-)